ncbi:MAG: hypothetical protein NWR72_08310 [Bacteroidia bacterium]|nr:hypothetical protein [Bacteroidia bacterium]
MKLPFFAFVAIAISIVACQPTPPSEAEVRAKLLGDYCDQDQVFLLQVKEDSTYFHRRAEKGVLTTRSLNYESCSGVYELVLEDGAWKIHFLADERPKNSYFKNCEQTVEVWNGTDGYLVGDASVNLPDLFESNSLTLGLCE